MFYFSAGQASILPCSRLVAMSAGGFLVAISLLAAAQSAPGAGPGAGAPLGKDHFFSPNGFKVFYYFYIKSFLLPFFKDGFSECSDG